MINFELHGFINIIGLKLDQINQWISNTIAEEKYQLGNVNYEFLTDEELLKINISYLNHDTYTDIITFNNSVNTSVINGDIFISVDRVKENSKEIGQKFRTELLRVIIHGVLHLCNYDDKTDEDKILMRQKEDYYLTKYPADVSRETK